jgi:hypothetical protein
MSSTRQRANLSGRPHGLDYGYPNFTFPEPCGTARSILDLVVVSILYITSTSELVPVLLMFPCAGVSISPLPKD